MRRTAHGLAQSLGRFFAWWLSELWAIVPKRLRHLLRRDGPFLLAEFEDNELTVSTSGGNGTRKEVRFTPGETPAAVSRRMIAELYPSQSIADVPVVVRLAPSLVLRKTVEMPLAAQENLRQVIGFDMDRQTPFTAQDIYYDFAVAGSDRENQRLFVDLVVAPREVVDRAVAVIRGNGLKASRVDVAWPAGTGPSVNLLQPSGKPRAHRLSGLATAALVALALSLMIAVVAVPLQRQSAMVDDLREQVKLARQQADVGRKLQEEIDRRNQQGRFIIEKKLVHPSFVETLNELTKVIPDETWLFRLREFGGDMQIFGYSSSATALIGLIEQSPLFADTQFRAPLTRDSRNDAERFHVGFRMVQRTPSGS